MFKGSIAAIVTPFNSKNEIDELSLRKIVNFHMENKTDALCLCGTTGEASTLSDEERLKVFRTCKDEAKNNILLIAGTGSNNTYLSYEMTKRAKAIGVDGALAVVPYYNKPSQLGVLAHFSEVSKAGLPIIVYNNPGRCSLKIFPQTVFAMEKVPHVVALKDASNDLSFLKDVSLQSKLPILSGDDDLTFDIMAMGGVGSISVIANIVPGDWKDMIYHMKNKKMKDAADINSKYKDLIKLLFLESNPQCVKYAMSLMGMCKSNLRLPLLEPVNSTKMQIKEKMKSLKII